MTPVVPFWGSERHNASPEAKLDEYACGKLTVNGFTALFVEPVATVTGDTVNVIAWTVASDGTVNDVVVAGVVATLLYTALSATGPAAADDVT